MEWGQGGVAGHGFDCLLVEVDIEVWEVHRHLPRDTLQVINIQVLYARNCSLQVNIPQTDSDVGVLAVYLLY